VRQICGWYREQHADLVPEFRRSLDACLARIARDPAAYPTVFGPIRRALLRRFPYCVFYILEPQEVVVIGVFHGRRDPATWQSRQDA
jgi:plasmid stabilization system protein ParE